MHFQLKINRLFITKTKSLYHLKVSSAIKICVNKWMQEISVRVVACNVDFMFSFLLSHLFKINGKFATSEVTLFDGRRKPHYLPFK